MVEGHCEDPDQGAIMGDDGNPEQARDEQRDDAEDAIELDDLEVDDEAEDVRGGGLIDNMGDDLPQ